MQGSSGLGDVARTLRCDGMEAVHCLTVAAQGIWWCNVQRQLYFWNAQDEAQVLLTELAAVPQLLRATDASDLFVLTDTEGTFYKLYELSDDGAEEDGGQEGGPVSYELERLHMLTARCGGGVTSAALSASGTLAAVGTVGGLFLFHGPRNDESSTTPAATTTTTTTTVVASASSPGVLEVSCVDYYGQAGCSHCCFLQPDVLALVSSENHLVSVRVHWNASEVLLERDGHVLGRPHRVLCVAASTSLLVVGLSDGTIRLLQPETLEMYKTIDVFAFLEQCLEPPVDPRVAAENAEKPWRVGKSKRAPTSASPSYAKVRGPCAPPPAAAAVSITPAELSAVVVSTAVGAQYITAATYDAVAYIHRDSFDFDADRTFFFKGARRPPSGGGGPADAVAVLQCATDGSWVAWDPAHREITHGLGAADEAEDADDGQDDVIHAHRPLPKGWLDPLQPPANPAALSAEKGSAVAGRPVRRPKGSGYADAPWSVQQQRRLASKRKEAQGARRIGGGSGGGAAGGGDQKRYKLLEPFSAHPFQALRSADQYLAAPVHQGAVNCLACTASGSVVSGSQDKSVHLIKYPVAKHKGDGLFLRSHAGSVDWVDCSLSLQQPTIVTGGAGGQLCVWRPQNKLSALIDVRAPADGDIRGVRFFYADKFISYAQGNKLHLCKYVVCGQEDGWKAVDNRSQLSAPIYTHTFDTAQSIAAMSCINYFTSSLFVLAGSNKEVRVLDVVSGQPLWCTANAHSRAIHSIAMCDMGRFVAPGATAAAATHTFFTAGMDSAVVLWDVRQPRRARQFTLHRNNALARVGLAASPEGYRVAVGSEDSTVVVYDTRHNGAPLQTLPTTSTCTALVWHPLDPVLIGGSNGAGYVSMWGQQP